jgi:hypothetical protein
MHLRIQRMTVLSPVGAEYQDHIRTGLRRLTYGCRNLLLCVSLLIVELFLGSPSESCHR